MTFFELSTCKTYLELTDDEDDNLLNELGESANRRFNNFLTPIVGSDNLPLEDELIDETMRDAVNFMVMSRYLLVKKDNESAEMWEKQAMKMRASVKKRLTQNADEYSFVVKHF